MKLLDNNRVLLLASDIEKSLHFYRDILGMKEVRTDGEILLSRGSLSIVLRQRPAGYRLSAGYARIGSFNLSLLSELPAEVLLSRMSAEGISPVSGILSSRDARGPMHCFYLADPDGNLICIESRPPQETVSFPEIGSENSDKK